MAVAPALGSEIRWYTGGYWNGDETTKGFEPIGPYHKGGCFLTTNLETENTKGDGGLYEGDDLNCDHSAESGYISEHMFEGSSGEAHQRLASDGDYCSYYGLGDTLDKAEEARIADASGTIPPPRSSRQEGDGKGNICADWEEEEYLIVHCIPNKKDEAYVRYEECEGPISCGVVDNYECGPPNGGQPGRWSFQLGNTVSGSRCAERCGMRQYISFAGQGLDDRPWAWYFGEPSASKPELRVSQEVDPGLPGFTGDSVCPILEVREGPDAGNLIELCMEEWGTPDLGLEWDSEHVAECGGTDAAGQHVDRVITSFDPGTQFMTAKQYLNLDSYTVDASANDFPTLEMKRFEGTVSIANLENIVQLVDKPFSAKGTTVIEYADEERETIKAPSKEPALGSGCGSGDPAPSSNPSNWALVGATSGLEMVEPEESGVVTEATDTNYPPEITTEFETQPPKISAEELTGVTAESASVSATVSPYVQGTTEEYRTVTYEVQYGTTSSYGSTSDDIHEPTGVAPLAMGVDLRNLTPNTTYHYRMRASEPFVSSYGPERTFKTVSVPPVVSTGAVSSLTEQMATLHATVDPRADNVTECYFEYGTTQSYGKRASCALLPGSGNAPVEVSASLTGLTKSTPYHYRIVAINSAGESQGEDRQFETPPLAPTLSGGSATAVKRTTATLNAIVNPNGNVVSACSFEYGPTEAYGKSAPCKPQPGSGELPVNVSAAVEGLSEKTTYYFRAVATNVVGTNYGPRETFVTYPYAPQVTTARPSSIRGTTATLTATVNPNEAETSCVFEYGTSLAHASTVACTPSPGSGETAVAVTAAIKSLSYGDTYYYRVVATNSVGTSYGESVSFKPFESCQGMSIAGSGEFGLKRIQELTALTFNTSGNEYACDGKQGSKAKPMVGYDEPLANNGSGLRTWGVEEIKSLSGYREFFFNATHSFLLTTEAPNVGQKAEILTHEHPETGDTLLMVPVAQFALAVYVNLPSGCTATSTSAPGRLALTDATLEGIYAGKIKKWGEIDDDGDTLTPSSCDSDPISVVAPTEQSGMTNVLKKYLNVIEPGDVVTAGGPFTWAELSEGALNTEWPSALDPVRPIVGGFEGGEIGAVRETPGSIGYGNLGNVSESGWFGFPSGGSGTGKFWVEIENGEKGKDKFTYADPAVNGDEFEPGAANCADTAYQNGDEPFPPPTYEPWNEVTTYVPGSGSKEKNYPLCNFVYALAFSQYWLLEQWGTSAEATTTVENYLSFLTTKSKDGGQEAFGEYSFAPLPKAVDKQAESEAALIKFQ